MTGVPYPTTECQACSPRGWTQQPGTHPLRGGPAATTRNSTTSFLTATTLVYAIGAGITAAAGHGRALSQRRTRIPGRTEHFLSGLLPLLNLRRSGAIVRSALFHRAGLARPLSRPLLSKRSTDALPCVTTAHRRSLSARSPRDQPLPPLLNEFRKRESKAFPVPGHLAGSRPDLGSGCSTSRRTDAPPPSS